MHAAQRIGAQLPGPPPMADRSAQVCNAKHHQRSTGARFGPVSCSALLGSGHSLCTERRRYDERRRRLSADEDAFDLAYCPALAFE